MTQHDFSRRSLLIAGAAFGALAGLPVAASDAPLESRWFGSKGSGHALTKLGFWHH